MDINSLVIFHKIAESHSFSTASKILNIPISTISRKINKLEKDLNQKLFIRTTRKIHLTAEGDLFYKSSKKIFDDIHDLHHLFENDVNITGNIRITSTLEHKKFLAPKIVEFRKAYPHINLHINFSNDVKDMIENSYDFAFRAGVLKDSSAYAYPLYEEAFHAYIHKNYFPTDISIESLKEFDYCMMENFSTLTTHDDQVLKPNKKIVTNSIEFIVQYAKHQPTIVYLPDSHVSDDFLKLNTFKSIKTCFQIVYLNKKLNRPCGLFLEFFKQYDKFTFALFDKT